MHVRQFARVMLRTRVIHNSFALNDGEVIPACRANKADCQWTEALSNLITNDRRSFPFFEGGWRGGGGESNLVFLLNQLISNSLLLVV